MANTLSGDALITATRENRHRVWLEKGFENFSAQGFAAFEGSGETLSKRAHGVLPVLGTGALGKILGEYLLSAPEEHITKFQDRAASLSLKTLPLADEEDILKAIELIQLNVTLGGDEILPVIGTIAQYIPEMEAGDRLYDTCIKAVQDKLSDTSLSFDARKECYENLRGDSRFRSYQMPVPVLKLPIPQEAYADWLKQGLNQFFFHAERAPYQRTSFPGIEYQILIESNKLVTTYEQTVNEVADAIKKMDAGDQAAFRKSVITLLNEQQFDTDQDCRMGDYILLMGVFLLRSNDKENAVQFFEAVAQMAPRIPDTEQGRGLLYKCWNAAMNFTGDRELAKVAAACLDKIIEDPKFNFLNSQLTLHAYAKADPAPEVLVPRFNQLKDRLKQEFAYRAQKWKQKPAAQKQKLLDDLTKRGVSDDLVNQFFAELG